MTLRRARVAFLVTICSTAILLLVAGGVVNCSAAILLSGSAIPLFRLISRAAAHQEKQQTLHNLADALILPPAHQDTLPAELSKRDRRKVRQSS